MHSENFFADGGRQLRVLDAVQRDYGLSLHGVGLSLGGGDPLDTDHLRRLKRLVQRVAPRWSPSTSPGAPQSASS